jgi:hypothetical protein
VANFYPDAKVLWSLTGSGIGTTISAAGNSGGWAGLEPGDWPPALDAETPVHLRDAQDVVLMVSVGAVTSSPTMKVGLDLYDDQGDLYADVLQTAAITAAGTTILAGGLHGGYNGSASSYLVLPEWGRVNWASVSGGTFTGVGICLFGR